MNIEKFFDIFSLITAVGGIYFTIWYALFARRANKGVWTKTYSATAKLWDSLGKPWNWGIYAVVISATFLVGTFHFSSGWIQQVFAMSGAFYLMGVGVFPSAVAPKQTKYHCLFAALCAVSAMTWVVLHQTWFAFIIPVLVYLWFVRKWPKASGLIIEWVAFTVSYLSIIELATKSLGWI
jgi:hypothetical protein